MRAMVTLAVTATPTVKGRWRVRVGGFVIGVVRVCEHYGYDWSSCDGTRQFDDEAIDAIGGAVHEALDTSDEQRRNSGYDAATAGERKRAK